MQVICVSDSEPVGSTVVTAPNGQYWVLSGSPTHGVYVNGDPWVVDGGSGVVLTAVSTPMTGTGNTARHGGMINPNFNQLAEGTFASNRAGVTAMKQGYDGRLDFDASGSATPATVIEYDQTLNAHAALPRTLHAGETLVSCTSYAPGNSTVAGANNIAFERMAALTVVNYIPEADEFRPPYFGSVKTRRRFSQANLALLPNWTPVSPFNPKYPSSDGFHIDTASIQSAGVNISGLTNEEAMHVQSLRDLQYWVHPFGTGQGLYHPQKNMPNYTSDWGRYMGRLAVYVMCTFGDVTARNHFVMRILQCAIDAWAVAADGQRMTPWLQGAGFFPSPLWFIRFAGLLFNDTPMKNAASLLGTTEITWEGNAIPRWGELSRVFLSTGAHAQYLRVTGEDYTAGFPLYGDLTFNDTTNVPKPVGNNSTARDPAGVYDMTPYKVQMTTTDGTPLPHANFPNILAGPPPTYEMWKASGAEQYGIGGYAFTQGNGSMGFILASFAMGDENFWGGAVVPYALRYANDAQMWNFWGIDRDYATGYTVPYRAKRDVYAHGGTLNKWMLTMWEAIVGVPPAAVP